MGEEGEPIVANTLSTKETVIKGNQRRR